MTDPLRSARGEVSPLSREPLAHPTRDEIRPGAFRIGLPLLGQSVGHVNVYCFVAPDGPLLIDTGWAIRGCEDMLAAELRLLGFGFEDVVGVLTTHFHVDHCGLAGRIAQLSGAWIGMHELDAERLVPRYFDTDPFVRSTRAWLAEAGVPETLEPAAMRQIEDSCARTVALTPDRLLVDGEVVTHGQWSFRVIHTPGHTPGHVCFYEERERLMFTGDHVFRHINTSATYRPQSLGDPLGDYLASLERLAEFDVAKAYPGHQEPFDQFATRLQRVAQYHQRRMDETLTLLESGASTVWEVAGAVGRSRPWSSLRDVAKFSACGETHAQLRHLERLGKVRTSGDRPVRWARV